MTKEEIMEILSPFIRFSSKGESSKNVSAFCPFHKDGSERKPSFYVYVGDPTIDKQVGTSFCHTCGEGWSLPALLRRLRVGRGIIASVKSQLDELDYEKSPKSKFNLKFDLPVLPEMILGTFEYLPKPLIDLGFTKKVLIHYEVGFDRVAKRITFPLRDHLGNLVGVSGRTVVGDYPRYKIYKSE